MKWKLSCLARKQLQHFPITANTMTHLSSESVFFLAKFSHDDDDDAGMIRVEFESYYIKDESKKNKKKKQMMW